MFQTTMTGAFLSSSHSMCLTAVSSTYYSIIDLAYFLHPVAEAMGNTLIINMVWKPFNTAAIKKVAAWGALAELLEKKNVKNNRDPDLQIKLEIVCPEKNNDKTEYKLVDYGLVSEVVKEGGTQKRLVMIAKWVGSQKNASEQNKKLSALDEA